MLVDKGSGLILEAIFIKTSNPILCRQKEFVKEFVYNLTLLSH